MYCMVHTHVRTKTDLEAAKSLLLNGNVPLKTNKQIPILYQESARTAGTPGSLYINKAEVHSS